MGMHNLLENDVEQVNQLATFAESLLDYHKQCTEILRNLVETLNQKREEAASRPKPEFVPKTVHDLRLHLDSSHQDSDFHHLKENYNGTTPQKSPLPSPSPGKRPSEQWDSSFQSAKSGNASPTTSLSKSSPAKSPQGPSCQALYDFDAENPGELGFKEGDVIHLTARIDENWYEGTVHGRSGYFPVTYVQILVPLPN
jgi:endophilin-A